MLRLENELVASDCQTSGTAYERLTRPLTRSQAFRESFEGRQQSPYRKDLAEQSVNATDSHNGIF